MSIAKVHKYIVKRFFLKGKAEASEAVFIFSEFVQQVKSLLSGIADNLVNCILLSR